MYDSTYSSSADDSTVALLSLVTLAVCVLTLVSLWKIYEKAGHHGWTSIIPIYNCYVEAKIAFGSGWLFLLLLVPLVNVIYSYIIMYKLAKAFGKSTGFCVGTVLLSVIFLPVLAFGSDQYVGPNGIPTYVYQQGGYSPYYGYQPNAGYQGYQQNGFQPNGYQGYQQNSYQPNGGMNNPYQQSGFQQTNTQPQNYQYQSSQPVQSDFSSININYNSDNNNNN